MFFAGPGPAAPDNACGPSAASPFRTPGVRRMGCAYFCRLRLYHYSLHYKVSRLFVKGKRGFWRSFRALCRTYSAAGAAACFFSMRLMSSIRMMGITAVMAPMMKVGRGLLCRKVVEIQLKNRDDRPRASMTQP